MIKIAIRINVLDLLLRFGPKNDEPGRASIYDELGEGKEKRKDPI